MQGSVSIRQHFGSFLRWVVLGATFIFLTQTLIENWQEVRSLQLQHNAWLYGGIALGIALVAQVCSALNWCWTLEALKYPVPRRWSVVTFLKNTPAKYIPGNIWHFYGRITAAKAKGLAVESATLSVILEPLFVIAGALGLALFNSSYPSLKGLSLAAILLAIHPRVLNFLWGWFRKFQGKKAAIVCMQHYPLRVLAGATLFMVLRGLAFFFVVLAFTPVNLATFQPLVSGFSFAWLLSLIIPAPGGIGVFEASALNVLDPLLSPALLLGAVAVYRLIFISAEVLGAGCAYLVDEG